jgi:hypothetical protein
MRGTQKLPFAHGVNGVNGFRFRFSIDPVPCEMVLFRVWYHTGLSSPVCRARRTSSERWLSPSFCISRAR